LKIFQNRVDLKEEITLLKAEKKTIGFVPTMGSLHKGHLSLIRLAKEQCDIVVCSIFINPTQFNDLNDYQLYPKHEESDKKLLESEDCDLLYLPPVEDVYPDGLQKKSYPISSIGDVLEGAYRPGHFDGVIEVVKRLFDIVEPDKAYFGMKDYQQLAVIRWLVDYFSLPIEIIGGPIIRNDNGLALSSRNERLNEEELKSALKLSKSLFYIRDHYKKEPFDRLKARVIADLKKDPLIRLEYLELADALTLESIKELSDARSAGVFLAAKVGDVRLIDNIVLF
jgi:pantoate--beta-alanine ligase